MPDTVSIKYSHDIDLPNIPAHVQVGSGEKFTKYLNRLDEEESNLPESQRVGRKLFMGLSVFENSVLPKDMAVMINTRCHVVGVFLI